MKKLLTLFTLLLCVCSGAWATTYDNPTRTTHKVGDATKTFVNASSTDGNVTSGNDRYLCYGTLYMLNSVTGDKFFERISSTGGTTSSSYTYSTPATGFLAASSTSGTNTYGSINASSSRKWAMYFTGATQVSVLKKDNNTSDSKWVVLKLYSVAANGTETLVETKESSTNADKSNLKVLTCNTALSTSTYYKLEISAGYDSNNAIYQVSLKKPASAPASYTVTYNANGGTGTIADGTGTDITLSDGTGFTAPANYSFAGWNTANDGSGTSYAAGQTNVNADLDLFATWTQNGTIDANTGSANTTYTATLNATSIAITTAPTKDGHVIKGYYTAATDGTKVANADGTLVASTSYADEDGKWNNSAAAPTLYAQWELTQTYTVTYDANGGTGTAPTDATGYNEGDAVTVVDNIGTLTKSGYSVVGWNTDPDATTASHAFGSSFDMGTADVTLYAIWQENFYEFTPTGETSGSSMADGEVVVTSNGGLMKYTPLTTTKATLKYATEGVEFGGSGDCLVTITLNDLLKVGSVIVAKLSYGDGKADRGVQLRNSDGVNAGSAWKFTGDGNDHIFTYVVPAGMANTNTFQLKRVGNAYLSSLTVTNCQPGGTITASGWNTYSSIKSLDLSTISGGTAYVAKTNDNTEVTMTKTTAKIAAGTGIMIKGTAGDTFTISTTSDAATLEADNQLVGLPNGGTVAADEYNFVFAWETGDVSTAGFYYVDIAAPTLPAGKAYLNSEGVHGAKLNIVIDDTPSQEETDGIKSVQGSRFTVNGEAYNLAGQRVGKDYKGIVIVNGKKMLNK